MNWTIEQAEEKIENLLSVNKSINNENRLMDKNIIQRERKIINQAKKIEKLEEKIENLKNRLRK